MAELRTTARTTIMVLKLHRNVALEYPKFFFLSV